MAHLYEVIGKIICTLIVLLLLMEIVAIYASTGLKYCILTSKTPQELPDNWDEEKYIRLREDLINVKTGSDDFLGLYYKPYSSKTINMIEADSLAKRLTWGCPMSPDKNDISDIEIYFFGGSTMFGYGVSDFETIPSFVSRILCNQHNIKININNFGVVGYVSTEEFLLFSYLAPKIKKEKKVIAVFLDGINEVISVANFLAPANSERKMGSSITSIIKKHNASIASHSNLVNALASFVANNNMVSKISLSEKDEIEVENNYKRNITNIRSVAKDNNIIPVFYWQPLNSYKKVKTAYENNTVRVPEVEYRRTIDYSYNYFFNISHFFENTKEPIFTDFAHYNELGNELIAEKIASDILKIITKSQDTASQASQPNLR